MYFIYIFAPEQQENDLLEGPVENLYFGGSLGKVIMYNDNILSYDMNNDFIYKPHLLFYYFFKFEINIK